MPTLSSQFGEYVKSSFAVPSHQIFDEFSARVLDEADAHLSLARNSSSNSHAPGGNSKNNSNPSRRKGASVAFPPISHPASSAGVGGHHRCVSAFQLADYLSRSETSAMPLSSTMHRLGAELNSTKNLTSSHADSVIKELIKFRENLEGEKATLPPPSALKALSLILLNPSQYHSEILQSVGESLVSLNQLTF